MIFFSSRLIEKTDSFLKKFKKRTPKILKLIRMMLFHLLNPLFKRTYYKFYKNKINQLPSNTQLFFIGRNDFGTQLFHLNYVKLWEETRGPTCIVILTNDYPRIEKLASLITPNTTLIYPDRFSVIFPQVLFGSFAIYCFTMNQIYPQLACDRPDGLHIFCLVGEGITEHNLFFDDDLNKYQSRHSDNFINAYKLVRKRLDYRWNVFKDFFGLYARYETSPLKFPEKMKTLPIQLGIKKKHVLLNINCKDYGEVHCNRRKIHHPERYNSLIDFLIQEGYDVVIQGRQEQPNFLPRKGLIDYAKSEFTSAENDLFLYSTCAFAISSKTGAELFGTLGDIPMLGLNYTELLSMQPAKKLRFYPKYLRHRITGKILSWEEHLRSSCFFEIGENSYSTEYEYIDLSEEDMLGALQEFLSIRDWKLSPLQKKFRETLTPLHLELFYSQAVPCEYYLKKSAQNHPKIQC